MQLPRWARSSGAVVCVFFACQNEPKPRPATLAKLQFESPPTAAEPSWAQNGERESKPEQPAASPSASSALEATPTDQSAGAPAASLLAAPVSGGSGYGFGSGLSGTISTLGAGRVAAVRHAVRSASVPPAAFTGRGGGFNSERYAHGSDNPFEQVRDAPRSTLASTVDTASYANVRRFLREGRLPPIDAVRVEELVNYFRYDDAAPHAGPIAISTEVAPAPWDSSHLLLRIGLRTAAIDRTHAPASNLVYLIDVSGSMDSEDKLPLLQRGLGLLVPKLRPQDHLAIVTYAGTTGLALPSTAGNESERISAAIMELRAGGSTNGAGGIQHAYEVARQSYIPGGNNRVILATDGDFNVGVTSEGELTRLIEEERAHGVFLSVLGFGRGNLNDSTMHMLAKHGHGNYAYIDSLAEAHKVLVSEAGSTLVTVAQDVKLQLEWNPAHVQSYRLIGFEDRVLAARDFNDDKKDAGELGADQSMTALYELVPAATQSTPGAVDPLRYQAEGNLSAAAESDELLTLKVRYKLPGTTQSKLLSHAVHEPSGTAEPSKNWRWSAAVACFGMLLRQTQHKGQCSYPLASRLARGAVGEDSGGQRHELVSLIENASRITP